jgi:hypothetical protein
MMDSLNKKNHEHFFYNRKEVCSGSNFLYLISGIQSIITLAILALQRFMMVTQVNKLYFIVKVCLESCRKVVCIYYVSVAERMINCIRASALLYCLPCSAFLFLQKILLLHQSWFNIKEAAPF